MRAFVILSAKAKPRLTGTFRARRLRSRVLRERISLRLGLVLLALLACITFVAACSGHTEQPPNPQELTEHGGQIYLEYCAECHQTDGLGWSTLFPRLAGNPIVTLHDPERIILTVTYGQGSMTGFRNKLTTDDIAGVLTYIRNSWGNSASAISPRQIH